MVVAAVGNAEGAAFCPGRDQLVFAIGFQTVRTTIRKTTEGGTGETAEWCEPSYTQCFNPDYTLTQPEGVLGSSFATPLLAGALALIEDANDMPGFIAAGKVAGMAEFFQADLRLKGAPTRQDIDLVKTSYLNALSLLPHRHTGESAGPPCTACSIFAEHIYVNAGLFFLECCELDVAEDLLSAARWFAPWSPHAAAKFCNTIKD